MFSGAYSELTGRPPQVERVGVRDEQLIMERPLGILRGFTEQRVSLSIPRPKLLPELLYRFRNGNTV